MNKAELIAVVAEKSGLTKKASSEALDAMLEVIEASLVAGEDVTFIGFGTFSKSKRAARKQRVPGSDRTVDLPETMVVKFKVGKKLKNSVASVK